MPITSTQVSNIIGGQVGMFSASAQYSQAISAQYGFAAHGAPWNNDPLAPTNIQAGGSLASGMAGSPALAMGALSTAAMFGAAPRMFDPFSMSMHMGARGFAAGGLAGGIGMGAATFAGYAGLGAIGSWGIDQMRTGAQNRMMMTGAINQVMPQMGTGGLNAIAGQMEMMNRQGMGSIQELTGLMRQGANSGALNTSSLSEFSMSFQKLVNNVRQVATALNTTMTQAQQAMQQVKSLGISSDNAAGFLGTARAFGSQVGMGPQQMMQYAGMGSQFAAGAGIDRMLGAQGAITQAGVYGLANRQGMPGILPDSYQRYMGGASRFLSSRYGRSILGAMLDTNTGGLDMGMARQINSGAFTREQINQLSRRNIAAFGRDAFEVRRGELGASFMSEFGPQGMGAAINEMTSGSSRPEQLRQMLTGLNRSDLAGMEALQSQTQRLTSQLVGAAREGFRQGQQQQSFSGALKQSWDQLIKPVRDKFRMIGADMTRSMQSAVEQFTGEFVRSNAFTPASYGAQMSARNRHWQSSVLGGDSDWQHMLNTYGMQPDMAIMTAPSGGNGGMLSTLANRLPSAFRLGAYSPGTGLDELPGYGLATETFSGAQSMGIAGMRPGGHALSMAGRGMFNVGSFGAGLTSAMAPSSGFMGMGGRGFFGGSSMLASRSMQGGGLLMRGLGWSARRLAAPMALYDLATNSGPEALRRSGRMAISAGAVTGDARRAIQFYQDTGVLTEGEDYESMTPAEFLDTSPSERAGLTPLGGWSANGTGTGTRRTQDFLTARGNHRLRSLGTVDHRNKARERFGSSPDDNADPNAAIDSAILALGDGIGENGTERVQRITRHLQETGSHPNVRSSDVMAFIQGKTTSSGTPIVSDTEMGIMNARTMNPRRVGEDASKKASDRMYYELAQAAHTTQSGNVEFDITKLSAEARQNMIASLDDTFGRANWMEEFGNSGTTGGRAVRSMSAQDLASWLGAGGSQHMQARFDGIYNFVSEGDADDAGNRERLESRLGITRGSESGSNLQRAWQSALGANIAGDTQMRVALDGLRRSVSDGTNTAEQATRIWMDTLNNPGASQGIQDLVSSGGATGYVATEADYRAFLTGDVGRLAASAAGLEQFDAYRQNVAADQRRWTQRGTSIRRGAREAAEMSGGNARFTNTLQGAAERYYTGRGAARASGTYSRDHHVAGRQQLIDSIQTRMAGSFTDDRTLRDAAINAGGIMSMEDAERLSRELLEEDDAGLQDLGQSVAMYTRNRRRMRTRGGEGEGRDNVAVARDVLGIRTSGSSKRNDEAFLRGEAGSVMSYQLERQLRSSARSMLETNSPGLTISDAQVDAQMGELINAIRTGKETGYDGLNRILSTQGAPGNPNASAGGNSGTGGANATVSGIGGELETLLTHLQSFNRRASGET